MAVPEKAMCEVLRIKPKLGMDNASYMNCLLRKDIGCSHNQPKTEAIWDATSKGIEVGLHKPFEDHIASAYASVAGYGSTGFVGLAVLVLFCSHPFFLWPYSSLWNGNVYSGP